ncbi:MAG: hypothetical protein VX834_07005, partial [Myxococcota bacterium]|nr:hypothetical protein [Myxococcota bacterium]
VLAVLDGASVVTNEHSEGLDSGVPVIRPSLDLLFIEPLMGRPSDVKYMVRGPTADGTERDDLILVSSFDGDALHVFTPTRQGARLAARVELASKSSNGEGVGRGPFAVEVVERQGRSLVFVTNFFEHSVTVFDFSAVHPSDFSQVAKVQNETIEISDSSF